MDYVPGVPGQRTNVRSLCGGGIMAEAGSGWGPQYHAELLLKAAPYPPVINMVLERVRLVLVPAPLFFTRPAALNARQETGVPDIRTRRLRHDMES